METTTANTSASDAAPSEQPSAAPAAKSIDEITREGIKAQVVGKIKNVYDPEIPVNIYEMGLIYDIDVAPDQIVRIKMTLTAPSCPSAQTLPVMVREEVESIPEVKRAEVEVVWEPTWTPQLMSEAAKLQLGFF